MCVCVVCVCVVDTVATECTYFDNVGFVMCECL